MRQQPVHPLPPGTQVGAWRVVAWQGQGGSGAVYRAVRVGQEAAGPVALKCSLLPWGARFAREAQLLSRLSHPSIPRLLDQGELRHASGPGYPFIVMEWVEGTPLYAWAEQQAPSARRLCQVLAQLARALEELHAAGAVHRDVKGDNVLVQLSDRRAVLIDFGSCYFQGAPRITWQSLAPGTPGYFSAQACLFHIRSVDDRDGYYAPTPADDLYALGVTAYRLVMGRYPPAMKVRHDEAGRWHVTSPDPRPLLEANARVPRVLREWILRLLSDNPEERGTAAQLAQAMEAEAAEPPPASEQAPVTGRLPADAGAPLKRLKPLARARAWKPWLALAAAGVCTALLWWLVPRVHLRFGAAPEAGTTAVGDSASTAAESSDKPASERKPVAQHAPPEPRPGQIRPDGKGRCPGRAEVAINGGCWVEIPLIVAEACVESGYALLKGKCYTPALESPKRPVPTSSPAEPR
ncbi:MAG TPA: serine/threonine-protein kinase [Myxococcaceae bacterium]|nr:serine/threonine-protein kinase [Myxococcaceae bacterium]